MSAAWRIVYQNGAAKSTLRAKAKGRRNGANKKFRNFRYFSLANAPRM